MKKCGRFDPAIFNCSIYALEITLLASEVAQQRGKAPVILPASTSQACRVLLVTMQLGFSGCLFCSPHTGGSGCERANIQSWEMWCVGPVKLK